MATDERPDRASDASCAAASLRVDATPRRPAARGRTRMLTGAAVAFALVAPALPFVPGAGLPGLVAVMLLDALAVGYLGYRLRGARTTVRAERDARRAAEHETQARTARLESLIDALTTEVARLLRSQEALRRAWRKAQRLAECDVLTGLPNRRTFERALEREWTGCREARSPLSLVICDVDRFREYNHRYGHRAGDQCLARVAELVAQYPQRPGDLLTRYGGEEFALLLPHTGEHAAIEIAEAMRTAVYERTILHGASDVERVVTVTCGVATIVPDDLGSGADLVEAAAHALHRAKRAGRNCVYTVYGALALDDR